MDQNKEPPQSPKSKQEIKENYKEFIAGLPKAFKKIETGYNKKLYRRLAECAFLAELAEESPKIRAEIEGGSHWSAARQKCPEGEYVKLAVHHMLEPNGRTEQAKASKYVGVLSHLTHKGYDGALIFDALENEGGIEEIYAEFTGRRAAEVSSAVIDDDDDLSTGNSEADTEDQDTDDSSDQKVRDLEVILKGVTVEDIFNEKTVLMKLTIGGSLVPGKPAGYVRVTGRHSEETKVSVATAGVIHSRSGACIYG